MPLGKSSAQLAGIPGEGFGISGGLQVDLGFPVNRVGLRIQGYYVWDFVQLNGSLGWQYNVSHLGPRPMQPGGEFQGALGAIVGWGPSELQPHPFLHPVANQTGRQYALGYAWKYYWDNRETSQLTALIGLHLGRWEILTENDAYTGLVYDRYRTGAFAVAYRRDSLRYMLMTTLWTGDPRNLPRVSDNPDFPARYGYKDLRDAPYGRFSHGILAAQVSTALPYYHQGQASIGIDAEQVRNFMQNRLIHDMYYFPEKLTPVRNPHYPMLDTEGYPYLYQPDQVIRRPRPYLELGLNSPLFY